MARQARSVDPQNLEAQLQTVAGPDYSVKVKMPDTTEDRITVTVIPKKDLGFRAAISSRVWREQEESGWVTPMVSFLWTGGKFRVYMELNDLADAIYRIWEIAHELDSVIDPGRKLRE